MKDDLEARAREIAEKAPRTGYHEMHAAILAFAREVAVECAGIARHAQMVPPDGGSPTEEEAAVAEAAYRHILQRFGLKGDG